MMPRLKNGGSASVVVPFVVPRGSTNMRNPDLGVQPTTLDPTNTSSPLNGPKDQMESLATIHNGVSTFLVF